MGRNLYLVIQNGKVEFKDASKLLGKDTYETSDLVRSELGQTERAMSVASIGPAGENLVKFSCIFFDKGHAASHNGVGAVMGSKKLKAIAVARGAGRPELADKDTFSATSKALHEFVTIDPRNAATAQWGTLGGVIRSVKAKDGILPVKNYTTTVFDIPPEKLEKFDPTYIRGQNQPKPGPCWACQFHHCYMMTIGEGPYAGTVVEEPEYEQLASWGPVIGQTDLAAAMMLSGEVDRLGVDTNEAGWLIGLVMECYEKGVLSLKDCDGLQMNWGNAEATREMLRRVARREGFGNVLAEGVMRAAKKIGGEATTMAIHTMKGNTPRGHDHRTRWPTLFDTCMSQMSTDEGFMMAFPADLGLSIKPSLRASSSLDDVLQWNALCKGATQFEDCLGVCRFNARTHLKLLAQATSSATGWDFSAKEGFDVGQRIVNLFRAFNIRHGHTAAMDAPSPRYGSAPPDGPNQGKSIMDNWDELRRKYYEQMGWDPETGKPLPDTLKKFGLDFAIAELWK